MVTLTNMIRVRFDGEAFDTFRRVQESFKLNPDAIVNWALSALNNEIRNSALKDIYKRCETYD